MKKIFKAQFVQAQFVSLLGIIALVAAIGLLMTGCPEVTTDDDHITWSAAADGTADSVTSTKITFTFSEDVTGLLASDITITAGTGSATAGALSGSGKTWELAITDVGQGSVSVAINKSGIDSAAKTIEVFKEADENGNGGNGNGFPTVGVTITPSGGSIDMDIWEGEIDVIAGGEGNFSVIVDGDDFFDPTPVTWSVEGAVQGTTITGEINMIGQQSGVLNVAAAQTGSLTVRAITEDKSKGGAVIVNIRTPTVTRIQLPVQEFTIAPGRNQMIAPQVFGTGKVSQDVTWSTADGINVTKAGEEGWSYYLIEVDANATLGETITLTVTSVENSAVSATLDIIIEEAAASTITGVQINPEGLYEYILIWENEIDVKAGGEHVFMSFVETSDWSPGGTVTWSIDEGEGQGTIFEEYIEEWSLPGIILKVGASETRTMLTLRATSDVDPEVSATVTVNVRNPTVTDVTIWETEITVAPGDVSLIVPQITATGKVSLDLTWDIVRTGGGAVGISIVESEWGVGYDINAGENELDGTVYEVTFTSVEDPSKSITVTVTIGEADDPWGPWPPFF